jgi:hypothetical protein
MTMAPAEMMNVAAMSMSAMAAMTAARICRCRGQRHRAQDANQHQQLPHRRLRSPARTLRPLAYVSLTWCLLAQL